MSRLFASSSSPGDPGVWGTLERLLLEQPWPVIIVLVVVAAVCWALARQRDQPRLRWGTLAALVVAVGLFTLAQVVQTDREQVTEQTERLLAFAAEPLDLDRLDAVIAPEATLSGPTGQRWLNYEQIREQLQLAVRRFGVSGHRMRTLTVEETGDGRAHSVLELSTELERAGVRSLPTTWALSWRKGAGDQWRISDIQWLRLRDQEPTEGIWRGL